MKKILFFVIICLILFKSCSEKQEIKTLQERFTSKTDIHPHPLIDYGGIPKDKNSSTKPIIPKEESLESEDDEITLQDILSEYVRDNHERLIHLVLIISLVIIGLHCSIRIIDHIFKTKIGFILITLLLTYLIIFLILSC